MNEFTVIFEKTAAGLLASAGFHLLLSLGAILAGIVGVVRGLWKHERRTTWLLLIVAGCFWGVFHGGLFFLAADDLRQQPRVAEGVVRVSHQQPYHGHSSGDKITVGGQAFEVDYFHATPGYTQTIVHGGALRDGVYARLTYYGEVITKVEVRQPTATPPPR